MRKHDCTFYLPLRRTEIHLSPSKAAFLSQLAFSYFIIPVFICLDVGFWEARPAQPELKHSPNLSTAGPKISPPFHLLESKNNSHTSTEGQDRYRKMINELAEYNSLTEGQSQVGVRLFLPGNKRQDRRKRP